LIPNSLLRLFFGFATARGPALGGGGLCAWLIHPRNLHSKVGNGDVRRAVWHVENTIVGAVFHAADRN
jgi:hypothetical protein